MTLSTTAAANTLRTSCTRTRVVEALQLSSTI
jgi:hypothetical protein